MAKLVYVGRNDENIGGHSSKAYTIRRRGTSVVAHFGSVESVGGGGGNLKWFGCGPREWSWSFGTEAEAAAFVKRRVTEKEASGYDRLPGRVQIR